jgi:hypothetical protein
MDDVAGRERRFRPEKPEQGGARIARFERSCGEKPHSIALSLPPSNRNSTIETRQGGERWDKTLELGFYEVLTEEGQGERPRGGGGLLFFEGGKQENGSEPQM